MKSKTFTRPANVAAGFVRREAAQMGFKITAMRLIDTRKQRVAAADAVGRTDLRWEIEVVPAKKASAPKRRPASRPRRKQAEFPFDEDGPADDEAIADDIEDDLGLDDDFGDDIEDDLDSEGDTLGEVLDLVKEIASELGIGEDAEDEFAEDEFEDDLGGEEFIEDDLGLDPAAPITPGPTPQGQAFSHIVVANAEAARGRRSFVAVVEAANELNDSEIVREASIAFPQYKVAGKVDRRTLASANEARVQMVAKPKRSRR